MNDVLLVVAIGSACAASIVLFLLLRLEGKFTQQLAVLESRWKSGAEALDGLADVIDRQLGDEDLVPLGSQQTQNEEVSSSFQPSVTLVPAGLRRPKIVVNQAVPQTAWNRYSFEPSGRHWKVNMNRVSGFAVRPALYEQLRLFSLPEPVYEPAGKFRGVHDRLVRTAKPSAYMSLFELAVADQSIHVWLDAYSRHGMENQSWRAPGNPKTYHGLAVAQ